MTATTRTSLSEKRSVGAGTGDGVLKNGSRIGEVGIARVRQADTHANKIKIAKTIRADFNFLSLPLPP